MFILIQIHLPRNYLHRSDLLQPLKRKTLKILHFREKNKVFFLSGSVVARLTPGAQRRYGLASSVDV